MDNALASMSSPRHAEEEYRLSSRATRVVSPLLKEGETASYLRLSEGKLRYNRVHGTGPEYLKIGRSVRYRLSDIDRWLEQQRRTSTRETTHHEPQAATV